jgi:dihydroflavonol-4-reductase
MEITGKKILITGASGSLGKQLIYDLVRRGEKPVAHIRESSDTRYVDSLGLEKRFADLRHKDEIEQLVEGVDAVIHTAAWVNFRQDRLTQFTGINTFAALELFQAAQRAGVMRFVHVSTVAAVAALPRSWNGSNPPPGIPALVDEQTPFNLSHFGIPYIMTKRTAEDELLKSARGGMTELIIVNPSIIVAPSRTGDDRGKAMKKFGRFFLMPGLPNRINLVDIRDVAPGIIAALQKGRRNERYILAGDNISLRDLVLAMSAILGKAPHVLRVPRSTLNLAARCSVVFSKLLGKSKISFYPDLVKMLDYDWAYSSLKARRELGYTSRSIHVTLNDLLNNNMVGTYAKPANTINEPV